MKVAVTVDLMGVVTAKLRDEKWDKFVVVLMAASMAASMVDLTEPYSAA